MASSTDNQNSQPDKPGTEPPVETAEEWRERWRKERDRMRLLSDSQADHADDIVTDHVV